MLGNFTYSKRQNDSLSCKAWLSLTEHNSISKIKNTSVSRSQWLALKVLKKNNEWRVAFKATEQMMPIFFFKCVQRRMSCPGIFKVYAFQGEYLSTEAMVTLGYHTLETEQDPMALTLGSQVLSLPFVCRKTLIKK